MYYLRLYVYKYVCMIYVCLNPKDSLCGHVYRMTKDRMVQKLCECKPISTGPEVDVKTM